MYIHTKAIITGIGTVVGHRPAQQGECHRRHEKLKSFPIAAVGKRLPLSFGVAKPDSRLCLLPLRDDDAAGEGVTHSCFSRGRLLLVPGRRGWLRRSSAPGRLPATRREIAHPCAADQKAFGPEQPALELEITAVPAEAPPGRDHPMTGHVAPLTVPHDVADSPPGTWAARSHRHVAICCHASCRNAADDGQYAQREPGLRKQSSARPRPVVPRRRP